MRHAEREPAHALGAIAAPLRDIRACSALSTIGTMMPCAPASSIGAISG